MSTLTLYQAVFQPASTWQLQIDNLTIHSQSSWAFIGSNGSGKSSLARALTGELPLSRGQRMQNFKTPVRLSLEQLSTLVEAEWQRNNSDLFSESENSEGRLAGEIIQSEFQNVELCQQLSHQLAIEHLLTRPFRYLSTGEARKVLLCQVLMAQPDLLILDEPFDGLDSTSREQLSEQLQQLSQRATTLILILNRFTDLPEFIEEIGILEGGKLIQTGERHQLLQPLLFKQLEQVERLESFILPDADSPQKSLLLSAEETLIQLRQGKVSWEDKIIFQGLDWQVESGQHWQISGPNGAGKSTLLSLVTGDHPQGYSNDLTLFGIRRGSGETIWDIKQHIGYVSSSLHLEYRVNSSVRNVILSGFFDSIGLYQPVSDRQHSLANQWLAALGLNKQLADSSFHTLSWGQQRLVLIVRALVKHPRLLILDEPLQGLDAINRQLVRQFINLLIGQGRTQLLFVSHHREDAPDCITHHLEFVPNSNNTGYKIIQYITD